MTLKRVSSVKGNLKKKLKSDIQTEETIDYTKSLTSDDVDMIGSGDELELAEKPDKIKAAKKTKASKPSLVPDLKKNNTKGKNKLPENSGEIKETKKAKGKPNATNGKF